MMQPRIVSNRLLLALYLIALLGLLLVPISGPNIHPLGVGGDKWVHVALFGGLAMLVRWNVSRINFPSIITVAVALAVIAATEVAQGFLQYRSEEWFDAVAGFVGSVAGLIVMNRILQLASPEKLIGLIVSLLGAMLIVLSLFADALRSAAHFNFGIFQVAGTILGVLVILGGVRVYYSATHT